MPANTLLRIGGQIPKKTNMPANAFCIGGHISLPLCNIISRINYLNNICNNKSIVIKLVVKH